MAALRKLDETQLESLCAVVGETADGHNEEDALDLLLHRFIHPLELGQGVVPQGARRLMHGVIVMQVFPLQMQLTRIASEMNPLPENEPGSATSHMALEGFAAAKCWWKACAARARRPRA